MFQNIQRMKWLKVRGNGASETLTHRKQIQLSSHNKLRRAFAYPKSHPILATASNPQMEKSLGKLGYSYTNNI